MSYNEKLAVRVRESLLEAAPASGSIEEKKMFGGLAFMVNDKMCICVSGTGRLMVRLDPAVYDETIEKNGVTEMVMSGKTMRGYVYVDEQVLKTKKQLEFWVKLALEFNKDAKSSKKRK